LQKREEQEKGGLFKKGNPLPKSLVEKTSCRNALKRKKKKNGNRGEKERKSFLRPRKKKAINWGGEKGDYVWRTEKKKGQNVHVEKRGGP